MDIITNPSCNRNMDPNMSSAVSWAGYHHGPGGGTDHPDQYGPGGSKTLGHQYGLRWLSRPWASARPPVATGAMDINPDPDYYWATIPDMAHGNNPGPEDIRVLCGSTALRHHNATGCSLDPRHPCGLCLHRGPQTSQSPTVIGPWSQTWSPTTA